MDLTEDEIIQKYSKNCGHCDRGTLLPYEYEWTCFSCNYNVIKKNMNSVKYKEKKLILSID